MERSLAGVPAGRLEHCTMRVSPACGQRATTKIELEHEHRAEKPHAQATADHVEPGTAASGVLHLVVVYALK